jgi:hypothetical protein
VQGSAQLRVILCAVKSQREVVYDPEERERMNQLCVVLQSENDPEKFSALLQELNNLLDKKERRFLDDLKKDPLLRG